jgi:VanZ family protein
MREIASTGRHVLAIAYALFVAGSTLLPPGTDLWLLVFDPDKVTSRLVGRWVMLGAFVGGLMLAALAWRRRRLWVSRLSLPLIGYMAVCGIGLALLVLVSQPPWYLGSVGLDALRDFAQEFDVLHIIFYFGFAVVAAVAWRGRVSLPLIGVLLMAFGYSLELVQEFVPKRIYRTTDLLSNGLGILLGLCWVYLYHSLLGVRGTSLSRPGGFRRPPGLARQNRAGAAVQPRQT